MLWGRLSVDALEGGKVCRVTNLDVTAIGAPRWRRKESVLYTVLLFPHTRSGERACSLRPYSPSDASHLFLTTIVRVFLPVLLLLYTN